MEKVDLYKVLEVSKEAPQDEIRRSYRRLARKYHPDANPGDREAEERFKEVQHAYEALSNPEKRREYDEGPRTFFGSQGAGRGRTRSADFEDISDLLGGCGNFGDIFGRTAGTTQRTREKGENLTVNIRLSFKDALNGVTTRVGVPVEESCGECRGTGAAPGTAPLTCPQCNGRGCRAGTRDSSRSRRRVPGVGGKAGSSRSHARCAAATAGCAGTGRSRSGYRQGRRTA